MISAVIICFNEEHTIVRSIKSAFEIADEVVVVDAESDDQTVHLAKEAGAVVHIRKWEGYGKAKNFGNDQAKSNWILSLDADEEMDDELISSIQKLELRSEIQFQFKIAMNYMGRILKFTEYEPHWKPRLFDKEYYQWDERVVHEKLIAIHEKKSVFLKGILKHYSFKSREHHLAKIEQYALLSAKELIRKNKKPTRIKRIFGPSYRFLRSYVLKLGFLEGNDGFFISKLAGDLVRKRHYYFDQLKG